jgi:hypothetical protein
MRRPSLFISLFFLLAAACFTYTAYREQGLLALLIIPVGAVALTLIARHNAGKRNRQPS